MKIDVNPSIVQLEPGELKNLVREVKETVATGIIMPRRQKKVFTAAELWNIQTAAKTAQRRMFI